MMIYTNAERLPANTKLIYILLLKEKDLRKYAASAIESEHNKDDLTA